MEKEGLESIATFFKTNNQNKLERIDLSNNDIGSESMYSI